MIRNGINASASIETKTVKRPPALWINDNIKRGINDRNNNHKALKIDRSDTNLQVAFDSVSHEILFNKLTNHGIDNFWFRNYLSARFQAKSMKKYNQSNKFRSMFHKAPSSKPILFIIFISDL